ncbi:hypothetical protein GA0115246_106463 [Streptomyces sp. SolWspMP-sol7th]|uniref:hypothetical protein n=1 Tax=Streptomyces sp. SolWspMP-sol7th TaxID=1839776 RepID=UPI00081E95E3|nr:hypothetical protein GA0115246_106463 [Streptomyces sp. SolWspMP-sol7th]
MTDQPASAAGTAPGGGPPARPSGTVRKLTVVLLGLTAVVTLMLCAFALPSVHGGPHGVPIGVSGPHAATEALARKLPSDEWKVTVYADKAALTADIEDGDVSGGLVLAADGPGIYTATAGAPMATNALTALGNGLAAEQHAKATVHELVPFTADDPRGSGFSAAALPMIFGGMFPAIILTRLFPGHAGLRVRLTGAVLFSLLAGFAVTALLQYGTGSLDGSYALTSLGMSLGMAALSLTFIGLEALVGFGGLGRGGGPHDVPRQPALRSPDGPALAARRLVHLRAGAPARRLREPAARQRLLRRRPRGRSPRGARGLGPPRCRPPPRGRPARTGREPRGRAGAGDAGTGGCLRALPGRRPEGAEVILLAGRCPGRRGSGAGARGTPARAPPRRERRGAPYPSPPQRERRGAPPSSPPRCRCRCRCGCHQSAPVHQ